MVRQRRQLWSMSGAKGAGGWTARSDEEGRGWGPLRRSRETACHREVAWVLVRITLFSFVSARTWPPSLQQVMESILYSFPCLPEVRRVLEDEAGTAQIQCEDQLVVLAVVIHSA